jgi:hypothetical protein
MANKASDPEMFAGLTDDESWVLRMKLSSGAAQASSGTKNHDVAGELYDVNKDLHAAWSKYLKSKK